MSTNAPGGPFGPTSLTREPSQAGLGADTTATGINIFVSRNTFDSAKAVQTKIGEAGQSISALLNDLNANDQQIGRIGKSLSGAQTNLEAAKAEGAALDQNDSHYADKKKASDAKVAGLQDVVRQFSLQLQAAFDHSAGLQQELSQKQGELARLKGQDLPQAQQADQHDAAEVQHKQRSAADQQRRAQDQQHEASERLAEDEGRSQSAAGRTPPSALTGRQAVNAWLPGANEPEPKGRGGERDPNDARRKEPQ